MLNPRNILFNPPAGKIWRTLYNKKLLVGFSGGKDSLALLHYLKSYASYAGWGIYACHVNHHLRDEESIRDEIFCREWCLAYGIKYSCVTASVKESPYMKTRGVEYSARKARYKLLGSELERLGGDLILTAHTLNDQLESFFVDLATGASIYTLGGIAPQLDSVIRPILGVSTDMINEYLESHSLMPVCDSSNNNLNYVRNNVRHHLTDLMNCLGMSMEETVFRLQKESRQLNGWLSVCTNSAVSYVDDHSVFIMREVFDNFSAVEKEYLLGKWISSLCRGGKVHIQNVIVQMETENSVRLSMPGRYMCEITPKFIKLFPENFVRPFEVKKAAGETYIELPDGRAVTFPESLRDKALTVRSRRDGDKVGTKKLKKLFYDAKLELYTRDRAVIVEESNIIIWAENLPEYFKIDIRVKSKKEVA